MADEGRALTPIELLAKRELKREFVTIPNTDGGGIWIQEMDGARFDEYQTGFFGMSDADPEKRVAALRNIRAKLIALTAINEDGSMMFDSDEDTISAIGSLPASIVGLLWEAGQRLSGLDKVEVKKT
jgi:hypothetical protein